MPTSNPAKIQTALKPNTWTLYPNMIVALSALAETGINALPPMEFSGDHGYYVDTRYDDGCAGMSGPVTVDGRRMDLTLHIYNNGAVEACLYDV